MKEILRKKNSAYMNLALVALFIVYMIKGPSESSFLVQLFTIKGYYAFLIIISGYTLVQSVFFLTKPFAQIWDDRIVIYKSPFKKYDFNINDLIEYTEANPQTIVVEDKHGNIYKINIKTVADSANLNELRSTLSSSVEQNK